MGETKTPGTKVGILEFVLGFGKSKKEPEPGLEPEKVQTSFVGPILYQEEEGRSRGRSDRQRRRRRREDQDLESLTIIIEERFAPTPEMVAVWEKVEKKRLAIERSWPQILGLSSEINETVLSRLRRFRSLFCQMLRLENRYYDLEAQARIDLTLRQRQARADTETVLKHQDGIGRELAVHLKDLSERCNGHRRALSPKEARRANKRRASEEMKEKILLARYASASGESPLEVLEMDYADDIVAVDQFRHLKAELKRRLAEAPKQYRAPKVAGQAGNRTGHTNPLEDTYGSVVFEGMRVSAPAPSSNQGGKKKKKGKKKSSDTAGQTGGKRKRR